MSITPKLSYYGTKTKIEFNGSCLKQDFYLKIFIFIEKILFEAVSLTKNPDINRWK